MQHRPKLMYMDDIALASLLLRAGGKVLKQVVAPQVQHLPTVTCEGVLHLPIADVPHTHGSWCLIPSGSGS